MDFVHEALSIEYSIEFSLGWGGGDIDLDTAYGSSISFWALPELLGNTTSTATTLRCRLACGKITERQLDEALQFHIVAALVMAAVHLLV